MSRLTGKHTGSTTLNCFSPPVMVATFAIEIGLMLYTLWRYKLDAIGRLAAATLLFLAWFQLSEYFVCAGGGGLPAEFWARSGFASITMLPALGFQLLYLLAGKRERWPVFVGYGAAASFVLFFLTYQGVFAGYECTGNYNIFQLTAVTSVLYSIYYYGLLLAAIGLGLWWTRRSAPAASRLAGAQNQSVRGLVIGYLVFLVPTAVASSVSPAARAGIPSIMCGFAVLFAIILALYIMPRAGRLRGERSSSGHKKA